MTPTVSIVTAFLNGEKFFGEAMASVFGQTFSDWELLLVDDGSTDSSGAFARRLASEQPDRVFYLQHSGGINRGLPASRNLALRRARGEYVAFLDADDVWRPDKLKRQVALLEGHLNVGMVYGPIICWRSWTGKAENGSDYICKLGGLYDAVIDPPTMLLRQIDCCDGLPATCGVLIRRSVIERVGGFDEGMKMYEDETFFSKVALEYPVYVMSEALDLYRQHPDSMCSQAILSGEYTLPPTVPNKARLKYLQWLCRHFATRDAMDESLTRALAVQIDAYRQANLWAVEDGMGRDCRRR